MYNGHEPATKKTKKDARDFKFDLKTELLRRREEAREAMHDFETSLLTAFRLYTEANEKGLAYIKTDPA